VPRAPVGGLIFRRVLSMLLVIWVVSTMNPDGSVARRRTNARGVDLNRNFPYGWARGKRGSIYYPGPHRGSEPETRAVAVFLERLRPDLVVSLHQAFNSVDVSSVKTRTWATRLAVALKLRRVAVPCGTAPSAALNGRPKLASARNLAIERLNLATSSRCAFRDVSKHPACASLSRLQG